MTEKLKNMRFGAPALRILLAVSLFLIIGATIALFMLAYQKLSDYAVGIGQKKADATASDDTIAALQRTERWLETNQDVVGKTNRLYSKATSPEFSVVDEVRRIARDNNMGIESLAYGSTAPTDATTTTPPPATPDATAAPPASSDTFDLTVTLSPFSKERYKNFLQFLYDIEQNLPKLKVDGVSLSTQSATDEDGNATNRQRISVSPIVLKMYVEK